MENIDNILTLEVKREIAQRYFGFRKAIEEDSRAYLENLERLSTAFAQGIGRELSLIASLLKQQTLIARFMELTGLPVRLLDDLERLRPEEELPGRLQVRGFTRKGSLVNLFFDLYARLCRAVEEYRDAYDNLAEDWQTIDEQIRLFYKKNDINSILHFLRGLESESAIDGSLRVTEASQNELEEKMRIDPPPPLSEFLPELPPLPEGRAAKRQLKALVKKAANQQPDLDPRRL